MSVRHRWRWVLGGVAGLIALAVLAAGIFIKLGPTAPPLALPTARASAPAGPLTGAWDVGAGSVAGFRVQESAVGFSNDVAGRTSAVAGRIVVAGDRVTTATFRIGLTTMKVGGKPQPQFATSLGTRKYPDATFTLARPVPLGSAFTSGATVAVTATGYLTMHGASHRVTVSVTGRRDGPALQAAGSIPVTFARWGIAVPGGFGFLGSLASHGTAEFLLLLHRR